MGSTKKLYFKTPFNTSCQAIVEKIDKARNAVLLDQTVAFPEGGGQEADRGVIVGGGNSIIFSNVLKEPGRPIYLPDFPHITVDNLVYHYVSEIDLERLKEGAEVIVQIDVEKRALISVYHSAAHLVFIGAMRSKPKAIIKGCSIRPDSARFDFWTEDRFFDEDLQNIEITANDLVRRALPIEVYPHEKEPEAWYWKCADEIIPCGGTHVPNTAFVGHIEVRRKRMAKNLERLLIRIPDIKCHAELYKP